MIFLSCVRFLVIQYRTQRGRLACGISGGLRTRRVLVACSAVRTRQSLGGACDGSVFDSVSFSFLINFTT